MKHYALVIVLSLSFTFTYAQFSDQVFSYNDNISFQITKWVNLEEGGFGYVPLRGYKSFMILLRFTNNSEEVVEGNLEDIFLANPKTKKKYELKYFNVAGIGPKTNPNFKLGPKKSRKFILFYIFEKWQRPYFLIGNNLTPIKSKHEQ